MSWLRSTSQANPAQNRKGWQSRRFRSKRPGHPFFQKLNTLLAEAGVDRWAESWCAKYYEQTEKRGQPSLPQAVYFRMLFVGYFENLDSQRGIDWAYALYEQFWSGIPKCKEGSGV